eukprot:TRINITY_DN3742_c0_g1_i4.p1 TRINITY_DN3742_c0_g1~~TRINITY_DN3742_c0_g1_i4.p1  ORF type:complete len:372 (-),score=23.64 TRINITY_DN3742_c0_g1_i4:421-1536(-)
MMVMFTEMNNDAQTNFTTKNLPEIQMVVYSLELYTFMLLVGILILILGLYCTTNILHIFRTKENNYNKLNNFKKINIKSTNIFKVFYSYNCNDQQYDLQSIVLPIDRESIQRIFYMRNMQFISHPNIFSNVKSVFVQKSVIYNNFTVTTQFDKYLKNNQNLCEIQNIDDLMGILVQISNAVEYLHCMHIVHGDIRPANIFIYEVNTKNKEISCRKRIEGMLTNFRSSCISFEYFNESENENEIKYEVQKYVDVQNVQHAQYLAPELVSVGKRTFSTDVYAFGVTMLELSTPYLYIQDAQETLSEKLETIPGADISTQLQALIKSCLAYSPQDRPSMESVRVQLVSLRNQYRAYQFQNIVYDDDGEIIAMYL